MTDRLHGVEQVGQPDEPVAVPIDEAQQRIVFRGYDTEAARKVLANGQMYVYCLLALLGDREHGEAFISHEHLGSAMLCNVEVVEADGGLIVRRVSGG